MKTNLQTPRARNTSRPALATVPDLDTQVLVSPNQITQWSRFVNQALDLAGQEKSIVAGVGGRIFVVPEHLKSRGEHHPQRICSDSLIEDFGVIKQILDERGWKVTAVRENEGAPAPGNSEQRLFGYDIFLSPK